MSNYFIGQHFKTQHRSSMHIDDVIYMFCGAVNLYPSGAHDFGVAVIIIIFHIEIHVVLSFVSPYFTV